MTAPLTYQVSFAAHELHDRHGKCPVTVCLQQVQPLAHASQETNGSCTVHLLHTALSLPPCTGIEQLVTRRVSTCTMLCITGHSPLPWIQGAHPLLVSLTSTF